MARPDDKPLIENILAEQERVTGYKSDRPNLFATPVLLTLVYENAAGEVTDALYFEAVAEMVRCGMDPEATRAMDDVADDVLVHLRMRGIRYLRVFVPRVRHLARKLAKYLVPHGFRSLEGHVHFYRKTEEARHGS